MNNFKKQQRYRCLHRYVICTPVNTEGIKVVRITSDNIIHIEVYVRVKFHWTSLDSEELL